MGKCFLKGYIITALPSLPQHGGGERQPKAAAESLELNRSVWGEEEEGKGRSVCVCVCVCLRVCYHSIGPAIFAGDVFFFFILKTIVFVCVCVCAVMCASVYGCA